LLERLSHDFRSFLKALEGASCPLCVVLKAREANELTHLRGRMESRGVLCGDHLELALAAVGDSVAKARATRNSLEALLEREAGCGICTALGQVERRLARAICRFSSSMRFRKALEGASLFCLRHQTLVMDSGAAVDFSEVQRIKVTHLRDALAQAALRNSENIDLLVAQTLTYLGRDFRLPESPPIEDSTTSDENASEFERWDEHKHFKRLADLESEAAGLRYRVAILFEENRRLNLARTASQTTLRVLEQDRRELLAEKEKRESANGRKNGKPDEDRR
jgi:hypothetical protein